MSDTELLDVVAVERGTNKVLFLEKEVPRAVAERMIKMLTEMGWGEYNERYATTAPCGRYAKGDTYNAKDGD